MNWSPGHRLSWGGSFIFPCSLAQDVGTLGSDRWVGKLAGRPQPGMCLRRVPVPRGRWGALRPHVCPGMLVMDGE